jgi:Tol biopolymer transport system component
VQDILGEVRLSGYGGGAWSPDGRRILVAERLNGQPALMNIRTDGQERFPVTYGSSDDYAVFSPDGRRVAFRRNGTEIWTVRADGSRPTRIYRSGAWRAGMVSWSPDGKQLAITTYSGAVSASFFGVFVIAADGSNLRAASPNCDPSGCTSTAGAPTAAATWTPDGRQLVYPVGDANAQAHGDYRIVNVATLISSTIRINCGGGNAVAISGDGLQLAVESCLGRFPVIPPGIGIAPITGSAEAISLTPGVSSAKPAWRP